MKVLLLRFSRACSQRSTEGAHTIVHVGVVCHKTVELSFIIFALDSVAKVVAVPSANFEQAPPPLEG